MEFDTVFYTDNQHSVFSKEVNLMADTERILTILKTKSKFEIQRDRLELEKQLLEVNSPFFTKLLNSKK